MPCEVKKIFSQRLREDWLRSYCDARAQDFKPEGFKEKSINRITEHDAYWFLEAIDRGFVAHEDGFFTSPLSGAKEQIFWSGKNGSECRDTYLWAEPVITIGACARLVIQFNWPIALVGMQSKYPWPFDLVCYAGDSEQERIVCEVKKDVREIDKMMDQIQAFGRLKPLAVEPTCTVERNSYRKAKGIRVSWPNSFWALGPEGYGGLYAIERQSGSELFNLVPESLSALSYSMS